MRSGLRQGRILVVRPCAVNVAGPTPLDAWRSGAGHPDGDMIDPVRLMAEELRPESRSTSVTFVLIAADLTGCR